MTREKVEFLCEIMRPAADAFFDAKSECEKRGLTGDNMATKMFIAGMEYVHKQIDNSGKKIKV